MGFLYFTNLRYFASIMIIDPETPKFNAIKTWAEDDRPREKFLSKGKHSLSNTELLAILIATGTKNESAVDLAKKILSFTNDNLNDLLKLSLNDLQKIKGIGPAKALTISAALELGRRIKDEKAHEVEKITNSRQLYDYFDPILSNLSTEQFWILLLSNSKKVIKRIQVSAGGVSSTLVDPKIIFKAALENLAPCVVLCHNHPSGSLEPSKADISITKKLIEAGKHLDIEVLDHIIIGNKTYYSFADNDLI